MFIWLCGNLLLFQVCSLHRKYLKSAPYTATSPVAVVRGCMWSRAKHEWFRGHSNVTWRQAWKSVINRQNKLHLNQHFKQKYHPMKPGHTYKQLRPNLVVAPVPQCSWHFISRSWMLLEHGYLQDKGMLEDFTVQHTSTKTIIKMRQSLKRSYISNKLS